MTWKEEVANLVDIWMQAGALTCDYAPAEMVKDIMAITQQHVSEPVTNLFVASAPFADRDETGNLPKAREQADNLLSALAEPTRK